MHAIDTRYNGCFFRSRLEARWAVFLDAMGVKYEYEFEGFNLDGLCYLPDFWLPKLQTHIEIKPTDPTPDEFEKAQKLAQFTRKPVYIFYGTPKLPILGESNDSGLLVLEDGCDTSHWWCECNVCGSVGIEYCGRCERLLCGCDKTERYTYDSSRLRGAYERARSYRF